MDQLYFCGKQFLKQQRSGKQYSFFCLSFCFSGHYIRKHYARKLLFESEQQQICFHRSGYRPERSQL